MPKHVPAADEKEYIRLTLKIDALEEQRAPIKRKLLLYHEKGYIFDLIKPTDTSAGAQSIPWKKVCLELIAKLYKTKIAQAAFIRALNKRFPKTERAPSFNIPGRKVKQDA